MNKEERRAKFDAEHPKRAPQKPWTKDEIVKVAREFEAKGALQLSVEMGRPMGSINGIVSRLRKNGYDIPFRPFGKYSTAYRDALVELREKPEAERGLEGDSGGGV